MSLSKRILVVEDDADIRSALSEILRDFGHEVATARDGRDALVQLGADMLPDIILLDLMMPVMSGADFRVAQLQDARLAQIPVVVLTADGQLRDPVRALGVSAAFAKPFEVDALLAAIDRVTRPSGLPLRAAASA